MQPFTVCAADRYGWGGCRLVVSHHARRPRVLTGGICRIRGGEQDIVDAFDPAASFGPDVAAHYDDRPRGDEEAAATFLAALAQGRRALEFAIGTGRIAL